MAGDTGRATGSTATDRLKRPSTPVGGEESVSKRSMAKEHARQSEGTLRGRDKARDAVSEAGQRSRVEARIVRERYEDVQKIDYKRRAEDLTGKDPRDLRKTMAADRIVVTEDPDGKIADTIREQRAELKSQVDARETIREDKKLEHKTTYENKETELNNDTDKLKQRLKEQRAEYIANKFKVRALVGLEAQKEAFERTAQSDRAQFNLDHPNPTAKQRSDFEARQSIARDRFQARYDNRLKEINATFQRQKTEFIDSPPTAGDLDRLPKRQRDAIDRYDARQKEKLTLRDEEVKFTLDGLKITQAKEMRDLEVQHGKEIKGIMRDQLKDFKKAQKDAFDRFKEIQQGELQADAKERDIARNLIKEAFDEFKEARSISVMEEVREKLDAIKQYFDEKHKISDNDLMESYLRKQEAIKERRKIEPLSMKIARGLLKPVEAYGKFVVAACKFWYLQEGMKRDPTYVISQGIWKVASWGKGDLYRDINRLILNTRAFGETTMDRQRARVPAFAGVGSRSGGGGSELPGFEMSGSSDTSEPSRRRRDVDDPDGD